MKSKMVIYSALVAFMVFAGIARGQQYYWSNLAGAPGGIGSGTDSGNAAQINLPFATAVDSGGNVYVADSGNNVIRKLTPSGASWLVSTIAGSPGVSGSADGTGGAALFNNPKGVAVDSGSNLYVADNGNYTIRKLTFSGGGWTSTTIAGSAGQSGFADAVGNSVLFGSPESVAVDGSGNVYVADTTNHIIRKLTPSGNSYTSITLAGTPLKPGYADGPAGAALFDSPLGVAVDGGGNVYVADTSNHLIRKISAGGTVSTMAGTPVLLGLYNGTGAAAMFNYPSGVTVDSGGNVYVADSSNHLIRKITPAGVVSTLAGTTINATSLIIGVSGSSGFINGPGSAAAFYYPHGVSVDNGGNVYVADTSNNTIRKVNPWGDVTTIAGSPSQAGSVNGTGIAAQFNNPCGIAVVGGSAVYVADTLNQTIRKVTLTGSVSTPMGGVLGSADGVGSLAKFNNPGGVASDGSGHLFVADTYNETIRMVTLSSTAVVTLSGSVGMLGTADGTGAAALFNNPTGLAADAKGNVYVADRYNNTIRKITVTGTVGVTTTIAGSPGVSGSAEGTGSAAQFNYPSGVAVDGSGTNIYVADSGNYTIRKLTLSGTNWVSTTLAGTPGVSGSADGTGGAAQFGYPTGIAVDSSSNVYVADNANSTIREISPSGVVTTIGGTPGVAGAAAGAGSAGLFSGPYAVAVDSLGNVYVADSGNNRIAIGSCAGSGSASALTGTGATLNGLVNPEGAASVSWYFQYGTTTAYSSGNTASQIISSGAATLVPATATLSGLAANTTYHYQIVVTASGNTFYGTDQTFTTLPTAIPAITSAITATGTATLPFSYPITASNSPTGFGASPLPPGLILDPVSGLIAGTPTTTGTTVVTLGATNGIGTGTKGLTLSIVPLQLPAITSGTTARGVAGCTFNYQIAANNLTTSYTASGLPPGLSFNSFGPGLISGILETSGTYPVTIGVVNLTGTTTALLNITIAPPYVWSNFAGTPGVSGTRDGITRLGLFANPNAVAVDGGGNIYVTDPMNYTIRKITPAGVVTTLAGTPGISGSADGIGSAAQFCQPWGITVDSSGNLYVADTSNNTIRKITPAGVVTTLAGTPGVSGSADGIGSAAQFYNPGGIAIDGGGNVYVADTSNNTIRKMTISGGVWTVTTVAGSPGTTGNADGVGSAAQFKNPQGITVDGGGNLYVADGNNNTIRKMTVLGSVWTVATIAGSPGASGSADGVGSAAQFKYPQGITVDGSGNLYVADCNNNTIRKMTVSGSVWTVTTVAGSPGASGSADGVGSAARFNYPQGITVDGSGNLYVADTSNTTIRKMTPDGTVSTLAGYPGTGGYSNGIEGSAAQLNNSNSIAVDSQGNVYVADTGNSTIRMGTPSGTMSTIAGIALTTGSADGTGSAALFNNPAGIALDSGTNLYIADNGNDTIRKLTPTGSGWTSTTLAGTPGVTGTTNGLGATTLFNNPMGIALDGTGNIYVADSGNNAIRKYLASSGSWTTLAGSIGVSGTGTANGTGTAAKFNDPTALALDAGGNIFVADYNNNAIRKITPAGVVTTFAGADLTTGTLNPSDPKANTQDGFASTALITHPKGVAVDASGNVYASAFSNYSVVKITPSGTNWMLGTIGGTADYNIIYCYLQYWASTAGPGFYSPAGMAVDSYGNLYVADSGANRISIGASLLPPSIGSSLTASGTVGMPFNYTIVAGSMTGPYSNYSVSGLPSGLSVNVATGLISGTPTVTGTFSPIIGAANLAGQTNATLTLAITNLNSYQTWRSQKFTPAQLLDPAICGDMGTPAGDGIFNLMKYALGLNPNTRYASSLVLPYAQVQTVSGTNYLTLAFTQNTAAADVTYSVEASTTLNGTWTEINPLLPANQVSVLPDTPSSGINTITVKDVQPASASTRRFMRLRVTTP